MPPCSTSGSSTTPAARSRPSRAWAPGRPSTRRRTRTPTRTASTAPTDHGRAPLLPFRHRVAAGVTRRSWWCRRPPVRPAPYAPAAPSVYGSGGGHVMATALEGTPVSDDELFSRIEVCPPYFALTDVRRTDDGGVSAQVRICQSLGDEIGPVSAAETGRHLAILGSVAAAFANPSAKRHFYLAFDAELRR